MSGDVTPVSSFNSVSFFKKIQACAGKQIRGRNNFKKEEFFD
jgi:hypothetical protein